MFLKITRISVFLCFALLMASVSFAQDVPAETKKGLDQRINEASSLLPTQHPISFFIL